MFENYNYEDWKKQFYKETKGKSPEDLSYSPEGYAAIQIRPYYDRNTIPPFRNQKFSLTINQGILFSGNWNIPVTKTLEEYNISVCYAPGDSNLVPPSPDRRWEIIEKSEDTIKFTDNATAEFIDGNIPRNAFRKLTSIFGNSDLSPSELWIIPGSDIFFTIGLIRGIFKYIHHTNGHYTPKIRVYLQPGKSNDDLETSLLKYTNKVLASLISGIDTIIWEWPTSELFSNNYYLFLNIAEILTREGKVKEYGDVLEGADFFEDLSDKVSLHLSRSK